MSEATRVLMVDDEANVLSGYRRTLGRMFRLETAESGPEALRVLAEQEPFQVVVTDMRMPEMSGVEFLRQAREKHSSCVYMMVTGNADQQTAIDAVNEGQIFRFLNKPCTKQDLEAAINACARQHELMHAERVLCQQTLTGCIKLLVEALSVSDPEMRAAIAGIRQDQQDLCEQMGMSIDWRARLAASLCLFGGITIPDSREKFELSDSYLDECAAAGAKLLKLIPRMSEVSDIVGAQRDTGPLPDALGSADPGERVATWSRMLRFIVDWRRETMRAGEDRRAALDRLAGRAETYDRRLLEAAAGILAADETMEAEAVPFPVRVPALKPGMRLCEDVSAFDGKLLASAGTVLSSMMIERLRGFRRAGILKKDTVEVWQRSEDSDLSASAA